MIGFIGGGNMAEALIKGLISKGHRDIIFYEPSDVRVRHLMNEYGVGFVGSNIEVVKRCDTIILAVKPQIMHEVLNEIKDDISPNKIVVSIAAGIRIAYIKGILSTEKIIRVMPNTPAMFQEGMSVISITEAVSEEETNGVLRIFESVGKVVIMDESMMDAVTAVSGSGPGFLAYIVESMINAAERLGFSKDDASLLTIQTFIGTAKILQSGMKPDRLREMVTSPKGTTYAGLNVLKERGIDDIILSTFIAARNRAEELGSINN
ncbi:MAG: pyrroline-5-carboxylate reductase [Thermodesulfovibrionales bacterium]|nr:pyrroline-5-carboxylate reductase [Thermodesulfovibrionales bacterium]